jgi:hypothetical protein
MNPFTIGGIPDLGFPLPPPIFPSADSVEDRWFRPPDDVGPNETLYVNNLNTRVKERELKPFLERVCNHLIAESALF